MAARVLLLLLLGADIHAGLILMRDHEHTFYMDEKADFCSVSKWTREGKELLWNASEAYYQLSPLMVSHSGQYQAQCWSRGNVTLERNSTLLVCDERKMTVDQASYLNPGQAVQLTCDGVGPNQSVQWAYINRNTGVITLMDDETLPGKQSLLLTVDRHSFSKFYLCLEGEDLRCDLRGVFHVRLSPEYILRSVGESLELNCSEGNQRHVWTIYSSVGPGEKSLNSTLVFPSLALEQTGLYTCELSVSGGRDYDLLVCPEAAPPAVMLFTGGENLTLRCGDWNQTDVNWFVRSNGTEGRVLLVHEYLSLQQRSEQNMFLSNANLTIRNVSLRDSGEFWCVVKRSRLCVVRSEFLVRFGEPEVDHRRARSVLVSVVLVMKLCVVVGVKVWSSRSRGPPPAAVEEQETAQLSPESDVHQKPPV